MHSQVDLAIHSQIIAERIRYADARRELTRAKPQRPRFRLSLRSAFGRRAVAGAVR